jgi:hypothetical protein
MYSPRANSGSTLVVTIFLVAILSTFVAVTMQLSQRTAILSHSLNTTETAESIANGSLELAFSSWRQICRNTHPSGLVNGISVDVASGITVTYYSPPSTESFANLMLPTAAMFPDVHGFSATRGARTNQVVSNYKVQAVDPMITLSSDTLANGPVSSLGASAAVSFSSTTFNALGLWGPKSYYYLASADVTLPARNGPLTTRVRQVFEKRLASPFQYAIFFMDDLEIQPTSNSPLTVYGAVHTNGTLYTATSNLNFQSTVPALLNTSATVQTSGPEAIQRYPGITYGDNWVVGFKAGDSFHTSSAQAPTNSSGIAPARGAKLLPYDMDSNSWDTGDSNPNNDGYHELIETAVSPATYSDPLSTRLYASTAGSNATNSTDTSYSWNNLYNVTRRLRDACGIQIECNTAAGTVTIKRRDGTVLTNPSDPTDPLHIIHPLQYGPAGLPVLIPPYADCYGLQSIYKAYAPNASAGPGDGGAISLGDTIQDAREGGTVKLITLDCSKLWDWNHNHGHGKHVGWTDIIGNVYPADNYTHQLINSPNVLDSDTVYITDTSANWSAGNRVAVRLRNCGRMTINTIVSDLPVYIQGDFNTGTITPSTRQSSNDLDWQNGSSTAYPEPTQNSNSVPGTNYNTLNSPNDNAWTSAGGTQIANYSRKTCVIVSDAITVLSNNWDDTKSSHALSTRNATNTTINCSLVSGIVPTSAGNYSGGAENFIRLLEDWTDRRLTVVGSQIEMWSSKNATGTWGKANVYNEPAQRLWYPEPLIQNVPGSSSSVGSVFMNNAPELMLVAYLRQRWYKE